MKMMLSALLLGGFAWTACANDVPRSVIDASIRPRQFTAEMLDHDVTQANIQDTICHKGYTRTVRPAVVYTNGVKFKLMREAGIPPEDAGLYELDHLICNPAEVLRIVDMQTA